MTVTINGTTGISSPGGDTSTSLATTNLSYTGTLTGGTGVIAIGTTQIYKDASGNVGVGTASPGAASGYTTLDVSNATNGARIRCLVGATAYGGMYTNGTTDFRIGSLAAVPLYIITGSNTIATFDTSGNLGLGVTPSTSWQSTRRILQVGGSAALWATSGSAGTLFLSNNTYYDGTNFRYLNTSGASYLAQQTDGSYSFNQAASGTAGNAITFTQAMTLDASGNLIVGDTSVTGQRIYAKSATSDGTTYATVLRNSSTTLLLYVRSDGYISTGTAAASPYNNTNASAANLYVDSGGLLYRSTSSARYKNSITDAVHGLAEVLKLRPVTYKGNNDGDTVFGGLIAEEVHDAGLTEFVQYTDDGKPDALAYGNMVSLAFKAIQELTTRLEALESKK